MLLEIPVGTVQFAEQVPAVALVPAAVEQVPAVALVPAAVEQAPAVALVPAAVEQGHHVEQQGHSVEQELVVSVGIVQRALVHPVAAAEVVSSLKKHITQSEKSNKSGAFTQNSSLHVM